MIKVAAAPEPFSLEPEKTAIIVVDMQNDFGSVGGMFDLAGIDISPIRGVIGPIARVLDSARAAGMTVIYLKMEFDAHLSDAGGVDAPNYLKHLPLNIGRMVKAPDGSDGRILIEDTWNTEILPELSPHHDDLLVSKHRYSGFFKTNLDELLRQKEIKSLVFTGCTTSVCVESTLRDAFYRDYRCLLLSDCTAEPIGNREPRSNHEASLQVVELLFGWVTDSQSYLEALTLPVSPPTIS